MEVVELSNKISDHIKEKTSSVRIRKYGVVALLVFMAAANIFANIKLPYPIVDWMLETDIKQEAKLWRKRVLDQLDHGARAFVPDTDIGPGNQGLNSSSPIVDSKYSLTSRDTLFLSQITRASDIYRFKLFDAEGNVFWSSRASDIGGVNATPYFSEQVMQGEAYYTHSTKSASEVDDFELHALADTNEMSREVAEVYTPVVIDGAVVGAIEFYTDMTDIRDTYAWRIEWLMMTLSAIFMTIFSVIVSSVLRRGRRQMLELETRTTQERQSLERQMQLAREVSLLGELNEWLQSSRSLDELFEMVARFMTHMLPDCEGSVYVYSNSRDVLDGAAAWNEGTHKAHIHPEECWGLRRGRTYIYGTSSIDFVCEHAEPHDDRPYFCFPILAHGETVGLMHLKAKSMVPVEVFRENQKLAQMCAEQISLAIANVQMRDQLQERSVRDPLTGLFNRRHMTDYLRTMIQSAQRNESPFSMLYMDVDHFKKFNDNHGHDAGDMVLRTVGEALERACDGDEIACRMGGEEFMLLLPGTDRQTAEHRAEKLRRAIEAITLRYGEKNLPRITVSVGVALFPDHGQMPQDLLRVADDAMYDAKAQGRNLVVVGGTNGGGRNEDAEEMADRAFEAQAEHVSRAS
ncbi:diguanylate cyclase [uncultured Roseobacter sp.]|uniref:sensor domain-containing diguanylate cyclase n=1 Tax=uncultured Roseobacter sp. TaxID=114847 RepID=UPI00261B854E|nr:diguanylate cyclase [uncultured Roseobacter sp.]